MCCCFFFLALLRARPPTTAPSHPAGRRGVCLELGRLATSRPLVLRDRTCFQVRSMARVGVGALDATFVPRKHAIAAILIYRRTDVTYKLLSPSRPPRRASP